MKNQSDREKHEGDFADKRLTRNPFGFLQVANPPSAEDLEKYYADRYYQTEQAWYRKEYPPEETAYFNIKIEQRAHRAKQFLQKRKGCFLDVGCGEGFALDWFAKDGWDVEGVDYSKAGIERINPSLIKFVQAGNIFEIIRQKLSQPKKYDLVWLGNVLEHVIDPVGLLKSLTKIVQKEGCLVVTVPNDGSAFQEYLLRNGDIEERFWIALPDHLSYFTLESLKRVSEATGWTCLDVLADFPIDWFLLHPGSNYIKNRSAGPVAHRARIKLERFIGSRSHAETNEFYRALGKLGLGRDLTAYLRPNG